MSGRLLPMWECTQNQPQPSLNRICPISACLEWRVAHWNGVSSVHFDQKRSKRFPSLSLVFGQVWSRHWTWFWFELFQSSDPDSKAQCKWLRTGWTSFGQTCDKTSMPSKLCRMADKRLVWGKFRRLTQGSRSGKCLQHEKHVLT